MRKRDNLIKEKLSTNFIDSIINFNYLVNVKVDADDYGIDIIIRELKARTVKRNGKYITELTKTSRIIDLQLKSTSLSKKINARGNIEYYIKSKNYNDLVQRAYDSSINKMFLIVHFFPGKNKNRWLKHELTKLEIYGSSYYYSISTRKKFALKQKVKIEIPATNIVNANFFEKAINGKIK